MNTDGSRLGAGRCAAAAQKCAASWTVRTQGGDRWTRTFKPPWSEPHKGAWPRADRAPASGRVLSPRSLQAFYQSHASSASSTRTSGCTFKHFCLLKYLIVRQGLRRGTQDSGGRKCIRRAQVAGPPGAREGCALRTHRGARTAGPNPGRTPVDSRHRRDLSQPEVGGFLQGALLSRAWENRTGAQARTSRCPGGETETWAANAEVETVAPVPRFREGQG